jgi:uncharacterized protein
MKKTILTFFVALIAIGNSWAQDTNEKLYREVINGDTIKINKLLKDKADPNYIKSEGPWMKVNMLITAVINNKLDVVKLLIAKKVNINWKDGFNTSAIIYAASKGNIEIFKLLLENGANINDNDGQGNSVLTAAKESGDKELISFIEDKLKN